MSRIENDGFVTRECDVSQNKRTCCNCKFYKYDLLSRNYICVENHLLNDIVDWRQKYECCERWKFKNALDR